MSAIALQGPWRRVILITLVPILLTIVYFANQSSLLPTPPIPYSINHPSSSDSVDGLTNFVKTIFEPIRVAVDAPEFTDDDGTVHKLPQSPRFTAPLGKKVLIMDVDSRELTKEGETMDENLKWMGIKPSAAGMLSHHLFAKIHGYDYKFIRAPDYKDRWGTWTKVPLTKEALKTHDYVVFLDADAVMNHPHLPLEWLMNYWGMKPETLIMMAVDPDRQQNYDKRGKIYLNTGFMVAQQTERTQEMFTAWGECPEETKYKDCKKWRTDWAHEQAAFGEHVRYDFNRTDDILELPCTDANGAPEAVERNLASCKGIFVRHYWCGKDLTVGHLSNTMMKYILPHMTKAFRTDEHVIDAKGFKLEGAEVIELTKEEREELKKKGQDKDKKKGH